MEDKHEVVDRQEEEGNHEFAGVEDSHKAGHMLVEVRSRHVEELADQYVLHWRYSHSRLWPKLTSSLVHFNLMLGLHY